MTCGTWRYVGYIFFRLGHLLNCLFWTRYIYQNVTFFWQPLRIWFDMNMCTFSYEKNIDEVILFRILFFKKYSFLSFKSVLCMVILVCQNFICIYELTRVPANFFCLFILGKKICISIKIQVIDIKLKNKSVILFSKSSFEDYDKYSNNEKNYIKKWVLFLLIILFL